MFKACSKDDSWFHVDWQGVDLRQYSKNVEAELLEVENVSIQDCILGVLWMF